MNRPATVGGCDLKSVDPTDTFGSLSGSTLSLDPFQATQPAALRVWPYDPSSLLFPSPHQSSPWAIQNTPS